LFSDFAAFVQELETRPPAMDEKNGAEIHSSGRKKALMSAGDAGLAVIDVQPDQDPPAGQACDWKSDVSELPTQATQPILPALFPDEGPATPAAAAPAAPAVTPTPAAPDREGGGSPSAAATDPAKDKGSQKFLDNGL
jgi:hypothetical protein